MTITQYEQPGPLPASLPGDELEHGPKGWVARLRAAAEIAGYIADTDFVPQAYRRNPAAIAAAILYGAEIGLEPMQSLAKVVVIKGRPSLTAEAQRALIAAAGHEIWFDESTITRAIAAGRRAGSDRVGRVTWSSDDAKRAGIAGGENWRRYPAEMLRARASAALARTMFADVIGGLAAAEELEGELDNGAPTIEAAPKPANRRRRPAPPAASPSPAPEPTDALEAEVLAGLEEPARAPVEPPPPADTQPPPEQPAEPLADQKQIRRMFATMRDVGLDERGQQREYISNTIGRTIASTKELTYGETSKTIAALEQLRTRRNEQEVVETLETELDAKPVEPVPYNEFPDGY